MTQQKTLTETSAGGIVYRKSLNGYEWLVIQHSTARHWGFPKGHIGDKIKDEKVEEAALREVEEEGGIRAKIVNHEPFTITYHYKLHNILRKKSVVYYLMEYISGDPEDHDMEIEEALFVPEEEVLKYITYDNDREAFQDMKEKVRQGAI